jgi:AcrR family transcriptional regulator
VPKRAGQQRAQQTRSAILNAALIEFSAKGFEAASIRGIAERVGLQAPLVTYHFRSKDMLWQAVAANVFERIREERDASLSGAASIRAVDPLKHAYRALFHFLLEFPDFHRFVLQETPSDTPHLHWLADTILGPLIDWLLPQIHAAQAENDLPHIESVVFHYMMLRLTSMLSSFGPEFSATSHLSQPIDRWPKHIGAPWSNSFFWGIGDNPGRGSVRMRLAVDVP